MTNKQFNDIEFWENFGLKLIKKEIKSIEKVQEENPYSDVYVLYDFIDMMISDTVSSYDGYGYFHDGVNRTNISVFQRMYQKVLIIFTHMYVGVTNRRMRWE